MNTVHITLDQLGVVIGLFASITAIIISLLTYHFHRRELFTKYITSQRVKHLEEYKNNFCKFYEACISNDFEMAKLVSIRLKLSFSPSSYLHEDMSNLLDKALKYLKEGKDINFQPLIQNMQNIIKNEWEQMKYESGSKKFKSNAIHDWDRYKKEKQF